MTPQIPNWLKHDPFVLHVPSQTVFEPQRKLIQRTGTAYLLDANDEEYPLSECQQIRLELLRGVYVVVTCSGESLSMWREGDRLIVGSGTRQAVVKVSLAPSEAVSRFASFFDGEVVKGDVEAILEAVGGGKP